MTAISETQRAIELLSVPMRDLPSWLSDELDVLVLAPGEREVDAVLEWEGLAARVTAANGPELAVRAEISEERERHARWVIRAIDQRARTLERVLGPLAERQREHLHVGALGPRAISVFELIAATGMHSEPIRRTLSGKRVRTPRGVVDPAAWLADARALRGRVEVIEPNEAYGERAERVLLRAEGGELFVLLADERTGWERGDEVEVDEDQVISGLPDAALEASLGVKLTGTLSLIVPG